MANAKSDFRWTVQCNGNGGELNKFMIELDNAVVGGFVSRHQESRWLGADDDDGDGNDDDDEVAEDAVVGGIVSGHQGSRWLGADGARSKTKEQLLEMKTRMVHIYQFRDEDGQPSVKRTYCFISIFAEAGTCVFNSQYSLHLQS